VQSSCFRLHIEVLGMLTHFRTLGEPAALPDIGRSFI
jgi:hypothetical protein